MKESDELFQLIQAMSRTEKGYFKKFFLKNADAGNNNYIRLFEFINELKEYDEAKVKSHFKKEVFIKQLHVTKNYLYKLILKSLRNYRADPSIDAQLMEYIRDAELLFEKSLYDQCKKILVKAKKHAYSYERHLLLLQIIRMEIKIYNAASDSFHDLLKEENTLLQLLENINRFRRLSAQIDEKLLTANKARTKEHIKALDAIMKDPLLKNESNARSFDAKVYFYNIHSNYYLLKEDMENSYRYAKGWVELMEKHPEQISIFIGNYITALNNLCIKQLNLQKYKECKEVIKKIKTLSEHYSFELTEDVAAIIFITSWSLETDLYVKTGAFSEITTVIKDLESGLQRLDEAHLPYKMSIQFNVAYLYFGRKEYKKALPWLNKIIHTEKTEVRKDIQACARLLHLIIHYELGDLDTLEYIARSIDRFLLKGDWLFRSETIILEFVKKLPEMQDKQLKEMFTRVKDQLIELEKNPEERISEYFDFISWLESKIDKIPFQEAYRKRQKI